MKIGFTGTRRGMTVEQRRSVGAVLKREPMEFHHGDCVGADLTAAEIAREIGHRIIAHPPRDPKLRAFHQSDVLLESRSYRERNRDIVTMCDMLIATPDGFDEVTRSGTWSTIREARRQRKLVVIVFPDGSVRREG